MGTYLYTGKLIKLKDKELYKENIIEGKNYITFSEHDFGTRDMNVHVRSVPNKNFKNINPH